MANPDSAGKDTSEHAALKSAQTWIRFSASVLATVAAALLATGVIPPESTWVGILTMIVSVAGLIAGEVKTAQHYGQARTALKIAKVQGGANPTYPFPIGSTYSPPTQPPVESGEGQSTSG